MKEKIPGQARTQTFGLLKYQRERRISGARRIWKDRQEKS